MNTRDLINAIADGDATEVESSFNSLMAQKVSEKLDDMRAEVAQTMFASPAEEGEFEAEPEVTTTEENE